MADVEPDPLSTVAAWYAEAEAAGVAQPDAAALATASADGRPSARMVLVKVIDRGGFVFFTNLLSRKGNELAANPRAALILYWSCLGRQVRVEGRVEELARDDVEVYWRTRPRASRIAAWASEQSRPVENRATLEARWAEADARFPDEDVPLPDFWGGYRVVPDVVELWEHRENRLHDRVRYERTGDGWQVTRLMP